MAKKQEKGAQFVQYFPYVLQSLRELGGSARPAEVRDRVVELAGVGDSEQEALTPSGQPRFDNRVAWSRFYLAKAGYIDASKRGVWSLTEKGRESKLTPADALKIFKQTHSVFQKSATKRRKSGSVDG